MATLPAQAEVEDVLTSLDAAMGASEAHGALCGMLCARGSADLSDWIDQVVAENGRDHAGLQQSLSVLSHLHQATLVQINDHSVQFELFLPDDKTELTERVNALAAWCQGYIYGLAVGGISKDSELPEDTRELISDFIEISRAAHTSDTAHSSEEDEQAFMEITEYVRMGILLINEELQPMQTSRSVQ